MVTICKLKMNGEPIGRIIHYDRCSAEIQGINIVYHFWKKGIIIAVLKELEGLKLVFRGRRPTPHNYKKVK